MRKRVQISSSVQLCLVLHAFINVILIVVCDTDLDLDSWQNSYTMGLFLEGFVVQSECSDRVQVDSGRSDLNITQVERL